jgi:hypothetical protein
MQLQHKLPTTTRIELRAQKMKKEHLLLAEWGALLAQR